MTRAEHKARIAYAKAVTAAATEARFMAIVREALGLNETPSEHLACFAAMFPQQDEITLLDSGIRIPAGLPTELSFNNTFEENAALIAD